MFGLSYSNESSLKSLSVTNIELYGDSDFISINVLCMKLFCLSDIPIGISDAKLRDKVIDRVLTSQCTNSGMYFKYPIKYILDLFNKFKSEDSLVSLFRESVTEKFRLDTIVNRFKYVPNIDEDFLKCFIAYCIGDMNKDNKCIKSQRLFDNYYEGHLSNLTNDISYFIQDVLENVEYISCIGFTFLVRCAIEYKNIDYTIDIDYSLRGASSLWDYCYEEASDEYTPMYNFYIDDIAVLCYETFSFDDYTKHNEDYSKLTKDEFLSIVLHRVSDYIKVNGFVETDFSVDEIEYSDLENAKRFIFKLCLHTCLSLDSAGNVNYFILSNKAIQDYLKANPSGVDHKLENSLWTMKWLYNSRNDSSDIFDIQKLFANRSTLSDLITQKCNWLREDDDRWKNCHRMELVLLAEEIRELNLKSSKLLNLSKMREDAQTLIERMRFKEGYRVVDNLQNIDYISLEGLQHLFKFYYELFQECNYPCSVSEKVEEIFKELKRRQDVNNAKAADIFFGKVQ